MRNEIEFKRSKNVYKAARTCPPFRIKERVVFVKKLVSLMKQGRKILFADEASFQLWHKPGVMRTWQSKSDPVKRLVNTSGGRSVTMYGFCSNFMEMQFMLYENTSENGWLSFLREIENTLDA